MWTFPDVYKRQEHGKPLGRFLGQALGGDFTEDQHQDGHHHSGKGDTGITEILGENDGGQGGRRDVDDVVADENGGKELIVVLRKVQSQLSLFASRLGHVLQPDAVEGCEGRFGGGKIGRQDVYKRQALSAPD